MKVKCQWVTCIFNSGNNEKGNIITGNCNREIVQLSSDVICPECGEGIDALVCTTYIAKKYEDYQQLNNTSREEI